MSLHIIRQARIAGFAAALLTSGAANAHTVWLEAARDNPRQYQVLFNGHGGKVEPADPKKLRTLEARDAHGKTLVVKRSDEADGIKLLVEGDAVVIAVHLDNGIHSRKAEGPSIEAPLNEVPGAIKATRALKYHKTIVSWQPFVTRAIGQPFEVVPVEYAQPRAGKPFRVRVLIDGEPAAGVKLGAGEDGGETASITDANGVAAFVPVAGFNKLWAGKREAVTGNPAYTELSTEYLLGFTVR